MPDSAHRPDPVHSRLAELMQQPEEQIRLAEAALLVAASEYPNLDAGEYVCRLDGMAAIVSGRVSSETDPFRIISKINQFLFQEEGFFGNTKDYYDPRNSFLSDVLDRKTGIPITLATVYLEIAERTGRLTHRSKPGRRIGLERPVNAPCAPGSLVLFEIAE